MNKEKEFPHLKLMSQSINGNYFGAFENRDENAKQGYTVFLSHTKGVRNYCECKGWSIRESCYHLKGAKKLEDKLLPKKESRGEREDG